MKSTGVGFVGSGFITQFHIQSREGKFTPLKYYKGII